MGPGQYRAERPAPTLQERALESNPGERVIGKEESEIKFSRTRGHHPKEEKAEGNLVVAVRTIEVSGKDEENKLDHQSTSVGLKIKQVFYLQQEGLSLPVGKKW